MMMMMDVTAVLLIIVLGRVKVLAAAPAQKHVLDGALDQQQRVHVADIEIHCNTGRQASSKQQAASTQGGGEKEAGEKEGGAKNIADCVRRVQAGVLVCVECMVLAVPCLTAAKGSTYSSAS